MCGVVTAHFGWITGRRNASGESREEGSEVVSVLPEGDHES